MKPVINLKQVIDVKSIIKTTLLSGLTAALWFDAFLAISPFLYPQFFGSLTEYLGHSGMSAESKMFLTFGIIFFGFIPFIVFGMLGGFLISLFLNCFPEHRRKDDKIISSLKYRTQSFGSYCLFIGEGFFCIIALLSLPLCIQGFISTPGEDWMNDGTPLKLALGILLSLLSALLVRSCEVHIAKERQSAAQSLPAKKRHYPIGVMFTAAFGGLLILLLAINIFAAFFIR